MPSAIRHPCAPAPGSRNALRSGVSRLCHVACGLGSTLPFALARIPEIILATFGDMVRVPGSRGSLQEARAGGSDIRDCPILPRNAVALAEKKQLPSVVLSGRGV